VASPDGPSSMSGRSNSNIGENGIGARILTRRIWEVDRESGAASIFCQRRSQSHRAAVEPEPENLWAIANEPDEIAPPGSGLS